MKTLEKLQIECQKLQRENTYLRQLLNLKSDTPLIIPDEKAVDPNLSKSLYERMKDKNIIAPLKKISERNEFAVVQIATDFGFHEYDFDLMLPNTKIEKNTLYANVKSGLLTYSVIDSNNNEITDTLTANQLNHNIIEALSLDKLKLLLPSILKNTFERGHTNFTGYNLIVFLNRLPSLLNFYKKILFFLLVFLR